MSESKVQSCQAYLLFYERVLWSNATSNYSGNPDKPTCCCCFSFILWDISKSGPNLASIIDTRWAQWHAELTIESVGLFSLFFFFVTNQNSRETLASCSFFYWAVEPTVAGYRMNYTDIKNIYIYLQMLFFNFAKRSCIISQIGHTNYSTLLGVL